MTYAVPEAYNCSQGKEGRQTFSLLTMSVGMAVKQKLGRWKYISQTLMKTDVFLLLFTPFFHFNHQPNTGEKEVLSEHGTHSALCALRYCQGGT